ncbi:class I SAM-dependent methyltransferase [Desertibaculum subflavum]|uniref:class I SAM-dependent methyltransferase n=1 Tax=Desertibaculum subflavum TaxID=2268458 RepID=UPI000E666F4F
MSEAPALDPGSFRDPKGRVFSRNGEIFRAVGPLGLEGYTRARDSGLLTELEARGWLVPSREIDGGSARAAGLDGRIVLQHPRLPFIAYPYEWPFPALKDAALLQLDLILACLDRGFSLTDASAYNIQFNGHRPQFIDVLSIQPYVEGEPWFGYRQFCEQFLNPLLLTALRGIPYHAWYRGSLEGIPAIDLAPVLRLRDRLSLRLLSHVVLQARLQRQSFADPSRAGASARKVRLTQGGYKAIVMQLRDWIADLQPAGSSKTAWVDYARSNTYSGAEYAEKRTAIAAFCAKVRPRMLWDIGCNSGDFAAAALQSGAGFCVGFDADHGALEQAYARAKSGALAFVPLYQDMANPSPSQGWNERERPGVGGRKGADALLALAIIHHLAIGRNVPLPDVVRWLVSLAPQGVIEFVPKSDPTVQIMLALRQDVFDSYNEQAFVEALQGEASVVASRTSSATGRTLFTYERA